MKKNLMYLTKKILCASKKIKQQLCIICLFLLLSVYTSLSYGACSLFVNNINLGQVVGSTLPEDAPYIYGDVSIICDGTGGTHNDVYIGLSQGASTPSYDRYMHSNGNQIGYNLFKPGSTTEIWGDDPPPATNRLNVGTIIETNCKNAADCSYRVAARLSGNPWSMAAGAYMDQVNVNLYENINTLITTLPLTTMAYRGINCSISTDTVQFPDYRPDNDAPDIYKGFPIHVNCSQGTSYSVGISVTSGGGCSERSMNGPSGNTLCWSLKDYPSCVQIWREIGTEYNYNEVGTGTMQDIGICAEILARQAKPEGMYSSYETVTVRY